MARGVAAGVFKVFVLSKVSSVGHHIVRCIHEKRKV